MQLQIFNLTESLCKPYMKFDVINCIVKKKWRHKEENFFPKATLVISICRRFKLMLKVTLVVLRFANPFRGNTSFLFTH